LANLNFGTFCWSSTIQYEESLLHLCVAALAFLVDKAQIYNCFDICEGIWENGLLCMHN